MRPPGCQHSRFVAPHAFGHIMYGIYIHTHIYVLQILYHIMLYINISYISYICYILHMYICKHAYI